jgi:hypothetical protein
MKLKLICFSVLFFFLFSYCGNPQLVKIEVQLAKTALVELEEMYIAYEIHTAQISYATARVSNVAIYAGTSEIATHQLNATMSEWVRTGAKGAVLTVLSLLGNSQKGKAASYSTSNSDDLFELISSGKLDSNKFTFDKAKQELTINLIPDNILIEALKQGETNQVGDISSFEVKINMKEALEKLPSHMTENPIVSFENEQNATPPSNTPPLVPPPSKLEPDFFTIKFKCQIDKDYVLSRNVSITINGEVKNTSISEGNPPEYIEFKIDKNELKTNSIAYSITTNSKVSDGPGSGEIKGVKGLGSGNINTQTSAYKIDVKLEGNYDGKIKEVKLVPL